MTEQKNTQKKKLNLLLADLKAGPAAKTAKALDALQVYGDYTAIEPLFVFLLESEDDASRALVVEFLSNLKDSKSMLMVMDCLQQSRFIPIRKEILTTIWNSPLDYSIYLQDFVKIAVENDYLTTLECLTVIENLDGPFEEKSFFESLLYLKDYHEGKYAKSKEKDHLVSEIALLVKDFEQNSMEDDIEEYNVD